METVRLAVLTPGQLVSLLVMRLGLSDEGSTVLKDRFLACSINGQRFLKLTRDDMHDLLPGDLHFGLRQDLQELLTIVKDESESMPTPTPSVSPEIPCSQSSDTDSTTSVHMCQPDTHSPQLKELEIETPPALSFKIPVHFEETPPSELGAGFKVPMHFGPALDKKLSNEDSHLTTREMNAVIDVVRGHVFVVCPNPSASTRKWLAKMLCKTFPALALQHPYSALKKMGIPVPQSESMSQFHPEQEVYRKLSRSLENRRHNLKKRFGHEETDTSTDDSQEDMFDEDAESLPVVERHHTMLLKAINSASSKETITELMNRTFRKRKDVILSFPANKRIVSSLREYPPLSDPQQLTVDMLMVLGKPPSKGGAFTAECVKNVQTHSKSLVKFMVSKRLIDETDNEVKAAVTNLTKVFTTKRKGNLDQQLYVTQTDQESTPVSTPFLLVNDGGEYIVMGNSEAPVCSHKKMEEAILGLMAVYHAFHLEYPIQAHNAYIFMEEFFLNGNPPKNSSYNTKVSVYAKFMGSMA